MIVRHNMMAVNAAGKLNTVTQAKADSTEKLSSGYKINRAADDAAGLTISEGMRWMIRGLNRASLNAQDGISLLQTADGALNESQSIVQRMRELSVQAANDTNTQSDRQAIQEEINSLITEIDRISENTEFNTLKLLDGSLEAKTATTSPIVGTGNITQNIVQMDGLEQYSDIIIADPIVGTGVTITDAQVENLNTVLKKQIVPQAVSAFLSKFSSLSTAVNASQISQSIGLQLYGDSSTTLAYVALRAGTYSDGTIASESIALNLSVNVSSLAFSGNNLTADSRKALETTIVHEMMHAFMDDALINGMLGATNGKLDSSNQFPSWFKEGMAQSAAGGCANSNDWVNGGLALTSSSTTAEIAAAVQASGNSLSSGSTQSQYGTGYLACMYLGYLAAGSPSTLNSTNLANGLDYILGELMNGNSLDNVINDISGGTYTSTSDFQNKFGDAASSSFISNLLFTVGNSGNGGVISTLTASDILPNINTSSSVYVIDDTVEFADSSVGTNRNWGSGGVSNTGSNYSGGSGGAGGSGGSGGTGGTSGGSSGKIGALNLQVGALSGQAVAISIDDMHAAKLGITGVSVLDFASAGATIDACDKALTKISETRSEIGAYMNRLEHTINNLDNTSENTQSAESRIRDTDMAEEMVAYSTSNILAQAGQAMLSQAAKMNESVLNLL